MPPAYAALWKERLPNARLAMVEQCGHLPHIEKAETVSRQVRDFLKGVAR
jgi:pimeloyl-ACP methyl ester carboxylesterase